MASVIGIRSFLLFGLISSFFILNTQANQAKDDQKFFILSGSIESHFPQKNFDQQNKFRYSQNFTIPESFQPLWSFGFIGNDSIPVSGLTKSDGEKATVKIFSGPDYQTKSQGISTYSFDTFFTTKYSQDKIYVNAGSKQAFGVYEYTKQSLEQIYIYNISTKAYNYPIVTQRFILSHNTGLTGNVCHSFLAVERSTMKSTMTFPGKTQNCTCFNCSYG